MAQQGKYLPAMQETQIQSLGWEDLLEKEMATHSSTLTWETHGERSLVGYNPKGHKESEMTEQLSTAHTEKGGSLIEVLSWEIYLNNLVFKASATLNLSLFINDKYNVKIVPFVFFKVEYYDYIKYNYGLKHTSMYLTYNLSIKNTQYSLKDYIVKAIVFPIIMYGCES